MSHTPICAIGMKLHKHYAANAQLHRSWESRPQFSLFFYSCNCFYLSLDRLGFVIISAERWRVEVQSESVSCIAVQAALVEDVGRRAPKTETKSRHLCSCPSPSSHPLVFIKNCTLHLISFCLCK